MLALIMNIKEHVKPKDVDGNKTRLLYAYYESFMRIRENVRFTRKTSGGTNNTSFPLRRVKSFLPI